MKKNLRTLGTILSLVAITSFTMTSCGEKAEEAKTTETPAAETPAAEPVAEPVAEPATTCGGDSTAAPAAEPAM